MNNIEELFLPYNESLELKKLGFREDCFALYDESRNNRFEFINNQLAFNHAKMYYDSKNVYPCILCPTYSQAFKFFRDKYNWQHSIQPTADQHRFELGYNYWIWNSKTGEEYSSEPKNRPVGDWTYETWEQAELECIKQLIKIVKEN